MDPIPPLLARRVVSENRFLRYVEEDLPDRHGRPYTYYQVESKWDAVVVVPLLADGRLLVERIYRHPYRRFFLGFDAAGRELEEETGQRAARLTPLGCHHALPGLLHMRLHLVLAQDLTPHHPTHLEAMELLEALPIDEAAAWAEADGGDASAFLSIGLLHLARWRQRQIH